MRAKPAISIDALSRSLIVSALSVAHMSPRVRRSVSLRVVSTNADDALGFEGEVRHQI